MAAEPTVAMQRTSLGLIRVYLGQCTVEEVLHYRDLFGAVTLQGKPGLDTAKRLDMLGELRGVDVDPAVYRREPKRARTPQQLGLDMPEFDWIRAQRSLRLPILRTAGLRVRAGDRSALRQELTADHDADVSVVLVLDGTWLAPKHLGVLLSALAEADRDVSLVLAAVFDPLDSAKRVEGLRYVLQWSADSGRKVELLRTDHAGLIAVTEGAAAASIGLGTSTRHYGLPMAAKQAVEHEERSKSPLVYVPNLLHWQRGARLSGLAPWRGAGITDCACTTCVEAGDGLLRFARTFTSVPADVADEIRRHDALSLSELVRSVIGSNDPAAFLRQRRQEAVQRMRSVESAHKVRLQEPPAWLTWP